VDRAVVESSFAAVMSAGAVDSFDRAAVETLLTHVGRVQGLLDALRLAAASRLQALAADDPSIDPVPALASLGRSSGREADRTVRRAGIVGAVPQLADALWAGAVSVDHLDVVDQAMRRLEPDDRERLAREGAWIATIARETSPESLAKVLKRRALELQAADAISRFERQRRATTLRTWTDRDTGMVCLHGEFDPEHGASLLGRVRTTVESLFHDTVPDTCPADDRKHGHLQALALVHLVTGARSKRADAATAEFVVVMDQQTLWHGLHADSRIDLPDGIDLPLETLRRMACSAQIVPVVLDGNGVALDVGRAQRLATPAQRRALRAMYATCAIPGCCVAFDDTRMHHVTYWTDGGRTDLDNFVPVCHRHHHLVHEGGWKLHLAADRVLTITLPDGTTRANPPPYSSAA
jgi:hypothetical protein